MPTLCLCYEVHEPYRLRRYTVFDMGQNSVYEDDDKNCDAMLYTARVCYLPMNDLLLKLFRRYGKDFKVTLCISGTALDQFEQYAPEVLESFQALAETGNVEFAAETAPHSLAFLYSQQEFVLQTEAHAKRVRKLFGKKPATYRNAELVYNNDMALTLRDLGFKTVLTEGADHVLGWRSSNFVYCPIDAPNMRLLLRNAPLSVDLGKRFSDRSWSQWPLTAEKYASWIHAQSDAEVINLFNDYHIFGLRNKADSGFFDFMEALPGAIMANPDFNFGTASEVSKKYKPVGEVDVPQFMSWDEDGRDLNAWLGNDMQKDAIHSLYSLARQVRQLDSPSLLKDFERLQTADHFHNMSTKWFQSFVPDRPNSFPSPYDAYIAYMNVLADFGMRVAEAEGKEELAEEQEAKKTRARAKKEEDDGETPKSAPGKRAAPLARKPRKTV